MSIWGGCMLLKLILFLVIGLVSGTIGAIVGLGGGIITVPAMLFLASHFPEAGHITPQMAVGTSLVVVIITALSSTLSYARQKRVDFSSGWGFFGGSGPGAILGAWLTRYFTGEVFYIVFGILMIGIALLLTWGDRLKVERVKWSVRREFKDAEGNIYRYGYHRTVAVVGGFLVGLLSGLFGIGGGALIIPLMVLLFQFPPHVASATSMFIIFLSSITGSITHLFQGNIEWMAVLMIAPGAWVGGRLGAWISMKMSSTALMWALKLAIALVAIRMIGEGLS
ncbi:putative membrane protein YfcA [Kroppenstedtia sanguinis]|uniref:Probable membrane transporter protein n=2 Tax=Kroppenstedtia sanguinis TaxID=1380684 RepID=A0ABW4C7T7_9BACL